MKPTLKVLPYRHHPKFKFVVDLRAFKKGRKFFKTRAEAEAEALRQRTLLERHSRALIGLSQREMSAIIEAKQKLAEYGETITDAVKHRVDHLERVRRCNVTASQLADEVIEAKRRDGLSTDYLSDLQFRLRVFCRDFGNRPIAGITVEELDNWLRDLVGSPKSRANYRANAAVMFSYAVKRRMLDFNPILHTSKPKLIDKPPEIFTVDELRSLLEAAQRTEPDIVPMLAIGAFAGLREAEIQRLDWNEIDLARGHIEVKAAKAKSARRRIVPIQANLARWLRPYAGLAGRVVPAWPRGKLVRARKEAGLARWPNNGLRHSFASYRLAAIHDAPRVSAELGHTSPQMLYSTYRELVLPEEADRYWKIDPAVEAGKVVAFAGT
jgi:integrase